jgi:polar amino acid transport system substrate-binding protein
MKKILFTVMVATIIGASLTGNGLAETIRWVQYNVSPYAAEHLPAGGFWCQLVREALALRGHDISIQWYPLKRAFAMVENGAADLSLGWLKTPEREKAVLFSDRPVARSPVVFFHRRDKAFDWETLEDLKGLRIGDRLGNVNGGKTYLAAEKAGVINVERVPADEQNLKKLLLGRIDVIVGAESMIEGVLRDRFLPQDQSKITKHPKPLHVVEGYAVFNRQLAPHLIHAFNDGIDQLRENGRFEQLSRETLQP